MNKKIKIILITLLSIMVITVCLLIIFKDKIWKDKITSSFNVTSEIDINEEKEVDWSNYQNENVTSNSDYKITSGGVYTISENINGGITVDTDDDVKIILKNVTITNNNGPAILILNSKNTYISLEGENTIKATVNDEYDAAIYSKDDLIIEGSGSLNISSNMDGITSKDDLTINNGNITINSEDDGIKGKDSVIINNGNIKINAKGDGIKSTNDEDSKKGYIIVNAGTINIECENDGIQAESAVLIKGGTLNIKTGNGATQSVKMGDMFGQNSTSSSDESKKGIKAGTSIEISGGAITINSEDDSIHANGNIAVNAGTISASSSDDGIHSDSLLEINGGNITITSSEGLEATYVKINDGKINITASDDGINAAKKTNDYTPTVEINGGDITISMGQGDTDGIDSNGNLYINGGTLSITGQSPFDYDGEAKYSGGTMIVNGSKTTEITNQFGGQMQGGGQMPGGEGGRRERPNKNI